MKKLTGTISRTALYTSMILAFLSCQDTPIPQASNASQTESLIRPNILWLVAEDMSAYLPPFGDSTIETPNLSRLAAAGVIYTHLFSPSGVCAPSRAAIATGLYPSGIGANHMRTNSYTEVTGLPPYEAVPPAQARMMSEVLRMHGYYCTNNSKQDYQFKAPVTAWDESSNLAHWRNREPDQPFFSIFNFTVTHESGLFEPYGFRKMEERHYSAGDTSFAPSQWMDRTPESETPVHVAKDLDFKIPPYLPDTEIVRRDLWKMYNNIAEMDRQIGAILDQLIQDGLMENTIIFFYADHGGPLPRQKRLIYDSGLNAPMIIRFPQQQNAGEKDDQLISFIDFAPTVFSLAGIQAPDYLQGQAFSGPIKAKKPRQYIHAAADRFDGFTDAIRAVRDERFKYIRNYRQEQGYYLPITYREQIPTMEELLELRKNGQLNEIQEQWFRKEKPREELFDCQNDPHELVNIADDPVFKYKLTELSNEMDRWLQEIGDQPNLPEGDLIRHLWSGASEQPVTRDPIIKYTSDKIEIACTTDGASIGYKIIKDGIEPKSWSVYTEPFQVPQGSEVIALAHRIGFKPSEIIRFQ